MIAKALLRRSGGGFWLVRKKQTGSLMLKAKVKKAHKRSGVSDRARPGRNETAVKSHELHVIVGGAHRVISVAPGDRVNLEGTGEEHTVWLASPGAESVEVAFRGNAPMMMLKRRETAERGQR
jgi:hypothetical protein